MTNAILLIGLLLSLSFAAANQSNIDQTALKIRAATYSRLNRKIYARHEDQGSGSQNRTNQQALISRQLKKMVANQVESNLVGPNPSASLIASSIATLQGNLTLSVWGSEATNTLFALVFPLSGTQTLAVAYVIMQRGDAIPDTQPFLEFYDSMSGYWKQKASAPALTDFEGCTFSVAKLDSPVSTEAWFLAWGAAFGNSHATAHARLYAFDGYAVRTVWQHDRLDAGRIKVGPPNTVTLDYRDWDNISIERHEVLHVTSSGLQ